MANRTVQIIDVDDLVDRIVKAGYSYRTLAKETSTSQTTISLIAKGERNPSPKLAVSICKALKCQFNDIFFIANNDKSN